MKMHLTGEARICHLPLFTFVFCFLVLPGRGFQDGSVDGTHAPDGEEDMYHSIPTPHSEKVCSHICVCGYDSTLSNYSKQSMRLESLGMVFKMLVE